MSGPRSMELSEAFQLEKEFELLSSSVKELQSELHENLEQLKVEKARNVSLQSANDMREKLIEELEGKLKIAVSHLEDFSHKNQELSQVNSGCEDQIRELMEIAQKKSTDSQQKASEIQSLKQNAENHESQIETFTGETLQMLKVQQNV
eukprot:TRINITY_DN4339_c0_g1_i1.p1 TRINITY_DN4339_c0_g1~~TRINITY_DN4339_c0_g1_i1.p1  ORF type:complete len:149 (+),score=37.66 TRINITY_DN4339_c0_g1_i1:681-1127(+)